MEVTGLDPAKASLDVARAKPGAEQVRWIHGDATALPGLHADLATMTGNVAQAVVEPTDWAATLRGVYDALRPGGYLVFESRDPAYRGWREWNRADSYTVTEISGVGAVESWVELTEVVLPLVSFRWTYVFAADGLALTSDTTLRFRKRVEVEAALIGHGCSVEEVRDAPGPSWTRARVLRTTSPLTDSGLPVRDRRSRRSFMAPAVGDGEKGRAAGVPSVSPTAAAGLQAVRRKAATQ
jgi:SAM-dependent methyltransferase